MTITPRILRTIQGIKVWRFRLRTILIAVLLVGLGLSWLANFLRRQKEQVALIADLNRESIYAYQYEPNIFGWALERLPASAKAWFMNNYSAWDVCYCPSRISAFLVTHDEIPKLIERMKRFPFLRSVSFNPGQISAQDEALLKQALPQVEVVFPTGIYR